MGLCISKEEKKSNAEFALRLQSSGNIGSTVLHHEEMMSYIDQHAELWSMLAINLNIEEATCRDVAVKVAFNLVVPGENPDETGMTASQFHTFRSNYVDNPHGSLEFFQRTVFAVYDIDNNGVLDSSELDAFIDIFYKADSIFSGDNRLPKNKQIFKQMIKERYDTNNDNLLSFDEIRIVISGKADLSLSGAAERDE